MTILLEGTGGFDEEVGPCFAALFLLLVVTAMVLAGCAQSDNTATEDPASLSTIASTIASTILSTNTATTPTVPETTTTSLDPALQVVVSSDIVYYRADGHDAKDKVRGLVTYLLDAVGTNER
jgi:hypothetical protein